MVHARSDFFQRKNRNYRPIFWANFYGSEEILRKLSTFFKKAVIFWKNETGLKVCWLGVEKLGIFGLFGGGVGVVKGRFDFSHGVRGCQCGSHLKNINVCMYVCMYHIDTCSASEIVKVIG